MLFFHKESPQLGEMVVDDLALKIDIIKGNC